jgi:hypothetical protein
MTGIHRGDGFVARLCARALDEKEHYESDRLLESATAAGAASRWCLGWRGCVGFALSRVRHLVSWPSGPRPRPAACVIQLDEGCSLERQVAMLADDNPALWNTLGIDGL